MPAALATYLVLLTSAAVLVLEILVSRLVADAVENIAVVEALTPVAMKGFQTAVPVCAVLTLRD